LGAQFILSIYVALFMFRATMGPSSGETTVFMRHLVLVILCGSLSGMQSGTSSRYVGWFKFRVCSVEQVPHCIPHRQRLINTSILRKNVRQIGFIYKKPFRPSTLQIQCNNHQTIWCHISEDCSLFLTQALTL